MTCAKLCSKFGECCATTVSVPVSRVTVGVGDLAKRHAPGAALALHAWSFGRVLEVGGDERGSRDMSAALVIGALRNPSSARTPISGALIAIEPRGADAALDLPSFMAELRLVERSPATLPDDY